MMNRTRELDKRAPQQGLRRHIGGIGLPEKIDEGEAERMWLPNTGKQEEAPKENEE